MARLPALRRISLVGGRSDVVDGTAVDDEVVDVITDVSFRVCDQVVLFFSLRRVWRYGVRVMATEKSG